MSGGTAIARRETSLLDAGEGNCIALKLVAEERGAVGILETGTYVSFVGPVTQGVEGTTVERAEKKGNIGRGRVGGSDGRLDNADRTRGVAKDSRRSERVRVSGEFLGGGVTHPGPVKAGGRVEAWGVDEEAAKAARDWEDELLEAA